jgi:hypothetical protein
VDDANKQGVEALDSLSESKKQKQREGKKKTHGVCCLHGMVEGFVLCVVSLL